MKAVVYGAEEVSTTKQRQFQVPLKRARQAATTWSDADSLKAQERFEHVIHQVTPAKSKLLDKLFERHERQLLQDVWTKASGPGLKFGKDLPGMKTAAEDLPMVRPTSPPMSNWILTSAYRMLRQKPPPGAWLILSGSLTRWRERFIA